MKMRLRIKGILRAGFAIVVVFLLISYFKMVSMIIRYLYIFITFRFWSSEKNGIICDFFIH